MVERCENCRFSTPAMTEDIPICVRFPPEVGEVSGTFPNVGKDWWCGEYQPKEVVRPPKLKPPVLPPDPEDAKPATVYALACHEWYASDGKITLEVKLHGVYASREAMEEAKAAITRQDDCRARVEMRKVLTFAWHTWEGVPMDGKGAANG